MTGPKEPAGIPGPLGMSCLQCGTALSEKKEFYWLGFSPDDTSQFWGYFCCVTCRSFFQQRSDLDKIATVMGGDEAVARLLNAVRQGFYQRDAGDEA